MKYYLVSEDDMAKVANKIRSRLGTMDKFTFPDGFENGIDYVWSRALNSVASVAALTSTLKPSSNSRSISFDVSGTPKSFSVVGENQFTPSTTLKGVIAVHSNGNNTYGMYTNTTSSGYFGSTTTINYSDEYFTYTYSDGVLTVSIDSSAGASFLSAVTYRLIYVT